jgi:hypothetical protein
MQPILRRPEHVNNKPLGKIADAELAKRFFAIWLSPQTSAPELRKKLFAE